MTVGENLHFWANLHGQSDIDPALNSFDLRTIQSRLAGKCSAGQKRRLGLARLLVAGRKLWLLDEPTVSLDQSSRDAVSKAIQTHLSNAGMAVIATHDPDLVDGTTIELTPAPQNLGEDPFWTEDAS